MTAASTLLIAFGFTNLAMLGWLAAAAAPLLIHLWNRRKFREVPWAAVAFLLAAMRKNARRMQLQQWLLLAVRTLIIVLAVLAVAEPYGQRLVAGGGSQPTHKVLVIDASFSMDYRDADSNLFARAKKLATQLIEESSATDSFTIIQMASPPKTVMQRAAADPTTIAAQIDALSASQSGADLSATLALVQEAVDGSGQSRAQPSHHEVYFFTDLQRITWQETAPESTNAPTKNKPPADKKQSASGLNERIAALAKEATLHVVDIGQPRAANLAITRLAATDTFATLGREITFEAALHQFGDEPRPGCTVEFLVDDTPVGEQTVDIPAGGHTTLHFTHRFQTPGRHTVAVRAATDRLELDNTRRLVVPVKDQVRVLCIAGKQDAARFVADALAPDRTGPTAIRPVVVSEGDLPEVQLADYECIFLCNVAQLTAGEAERLARYAADGGGVVIFLGDRIVPERYNALARGEQSLLPAQLGELTTNSKFGLDPLDYRHPIVAPFHGSERAGLLTTPISRYFRLNVAADKRNVDIAAALLNGDPFVVTSALGHGRVVLVATDASLASVDPTTSEPWTNWPTWPSFLPMIREFLSYAAGGRQEQWEQTVGAPLAGVLSTPPSDDLLPITRPDGRTDSVRVTSSPSGWQWSYDQTDSSGIYRVGRDATSAQAQFFAVNVDTTESDLAKADPQQLPAELTIRDTWQSDTTATAGILLAGTAWQRSFLWAAVALLLIESLLAWRFGRGVA